ncbi:MAG: prepilin-type N-terminal cleavage/methylation domain-containing protein [Candidatus Gracilibacteria bacterium]|nr:prepilin-type N-terminal cleavage/methylation domain-containing protein [Candidatus Gracilibacteria bacterium]
MILRKVFAFTLVELMIVITIMALIGTVGYMNYAYSQNKMNLNFTSKDISQALYNARNMAVNGLDSSSGNVSIGVFFDNSLGNNNKIELYTYPYDMDIASEDLISTSKKTFLKEIDFYKGISIVNVEGKDKFLFLFQAVTGSGYYYYWDSTPGKKDFVGSKIDIKVSLGANGTTTLSKDLNYIVGTNIIDY